MTVFRTDYPVILYQVWNAWHTLHLFFPLLDSLLVTSSPVPSNSPSPAPQMYELTNTCQEHSGSPTRGKIKRVSWTGCKECAGSDPSSDEGNDQFQNLDFFLFLFLSDCIYYIAYWLNIAYPAGGGIKNTDGVPSQWCHQNIHASQSHHQQHQSHLKRHL